MMSIHLEKGNFYLKNGAFDKYFEKVYKKRANI